MLSVQRKFGLRVRQLRTQRGWTLETLAAKAGKHWTYLGGIERGRRNPTISVVEAIADALEVPISELFPDRTGGSRGRSVGDASIRE
ncbi:helix-turn-helix transcriptional regulator [Haliangium sp. UPWRP_2]|uniref:helix-turn-helix domain-containing protein n=1 Tax=Haliangium sp. UPWRP_2 TaxID=1931276 RepID=UPI000B5492A9|nr:XRE family transcriptional regulator [Haliangium sp. UPWRP_2]